MLDPPSAPRYPFHSHASNAGSEALQARRDGSFFGAIAQLGERLLCKQEVIGSIPAGPSPGDSKPHRHLVRMMFLPSDPTEPQVV
jgi:hypothetical protein